MEKSITDRWTKLWKHKEGCTCMSCYIKQTQLDLDKMDNDTYDLVLRQLKIHCEA